MQGCQFAMVTLRKTQVVRGKTSTSYEPNSELVKDILQITLRCTAPQCFSDKLESCKHGRRFFGIKFPISARSAKFFHGFDSDHFYLGYLFNISILIRKALRVASR